METPQPKPGFELLPGSSATTTLSGRAQGAHFQEKSAIFAHGHQPRNIPSIRRSSGRFFPAPLVRRDLSEGVGEEATEASYDEENGAGVRNWGGYRRQYHGGAPVEAQDPATGGCSIFLLLDACILVAERGGRHRVEILSRAWSYILSLIRTFGLH